MAWENASGFADKINPILLSDTLLSQVSNNNETQTLIRNTGGNIPEGVTINTNYIGLPITGTGDYSAPFSVYAEDNALVWNYSNWNYDGRKGSGCQLINPTNSRVMYQYSELRNIATNPINTWGFIVNHDLHYAKVVLLVNENGFGSLIVYALNESYGDATALYNALINNPYIPPDQNRSGGAGSGYIGNSLLSSKKMIGYNVPTSSAESTKTESVNEASETPVSGKPKIGNGFAKIKLISQAQQKVDISASNQLKNNGVSPTVIMGTLGEYDSQTQSYYFSDTCSFSYSNAVISKSELLNAKRLYLEMELRLDNESVGINIDATIHIRYGTDGYRLLGVVAGNGESGTGDYSFFWMDNGTVQKNDTAPLDVSTNRGAFHKVKFELLMSNGTVTTMNCYLDGVLYKTKSVNETFILDYDEYTIYCDILKYAYVKSYKVEVV